MSVSQQTVGNSIGTAEFEPALHCIVLTRHQLYHNRHRGLALTDSGRHIPCFLTFNIIGCATMRNVAHLCEVEGTVRIVGNAVFKAAVGREQHVLRVSHTGSVHNEAILEGLSCEVSHRHRPDTIGILGHRQTFRQNLTLQFHLLGLRSLHAENDAVLRILRRKDSPWEETSHHARRELLFLTSLGGSGLSVLHSRLGSLLVEQQRQGL